jgi:hypothetical protein
MKVKMLVELLGKLRGLKLGLLVGVKVTWLEPGREFVKESRLERTAPL